MSKLSELLLRVLIWALAGAVFGGLFGGLSAYWQQALDSPWLIVTLATAIAGTITAAFFGAMLIALMAAMAGVLSAVGYLVAAGSGGSLLPLILIAAAVAALFGTAMPKSETLRVRALGHAASGLAAGLVAGPATTVTVAVFDLPLDGPYTAGVAVAFVGILFIIISRIVTPACPDWLSRRFSAPVVAAVVAATVAVALWTVGTSFTAGGTPIAPGDVQTIFGSVPWSLVGGAVGGALGGAGLEVLGIAPSEYHL
jgi:hypothetical protein